MLQDIQEDIVSLSVDSSKLAFIPLTSQDENGNGSTKDASTCTNTKRHRVREKFLRPLMIVMFVCFINELKITSVMCIA